MRAAVFTELSGPTGVAIREIDAPEPGPGEAVVTVDACALNHHDLWILRGESALVGDEDLPFVTGLDVAGSVARTGDGVSSVAPGDRVLLCPNETCGLCDYCREGPENLCENFSLYHGGLAEEARVDADRLIAVPDSIDAAAAAAIPTAYMTAWHMIQRADVGPGDLVLVPGATGGVGVAAIQLLDLLGAEIIGTSRSADKLHRAEQRGLDHSIRTDDPGEMADAVRDIGRPAVVLNHVGGEYTGAGLRVLRRGGVMVVCGRTAGNQPEINLGRFFLSHQRLIGSTMGTQPELRRLVTLAADGAFEPVIGGEYPLEETAVAFETMAERDVFGKLVIRP